MCRSTRLSMSRGLSTNLHFRFHAYLEQLPRLLAGNETWTHEAILFRDQKGRETLLVPSDSGFRADAHILCGDLAGSFRSVSPRKPPASADRFRNSHLPSSKRKYAVKSDEVSRFPLLSSLRSSIGTRISLPAAPIAPAETFAAATTTRREG